MPDFLCKILGCTTILFLFEFHLSPDVGDNGHRTKTTRSILLFACVENWSISWNIWSRLLRPFINNTFWQILMVYTPNTSHSLSFEFSNSQVWQLIDFTMRVFFYTICPPFVNFADLATMMCNITKLLLLRYISYWKQNNYLNNKVGYLQPLILFPYRYMVIDHLMVIMFAMY